MNFKRWSSGMNIAAGLLTIASLIALFFEWSVSGALGVAAGSAGWIATYFATRDAERVERHVDALAARARPRTVNDDARATMLGWLQVGRPETPVQVESISEQEPFELAKQLRAILVEAGWPVAKGIDAGMAIGAPIVGVSVRVSADADPPEAAATLQHALDKAGVPARLLRVRNVKPGEVRLIVGTKP